MRRTLKKRLAYMRKFEIELKSYFNYPIQQTLRTELPKCRAKAGDTGPQEVDSDSDDSSEDQFYEVNGRNWPNGSNGQEEKDRFKTEGEEQGVDDAFKEHFACGGLQHGTCIGEVKSDPVGSRRAVMASFNRNSVIMRHAINYTWKGVADKRDALTKDFAMKEILPLLSLKKEI